MKLDVSQRLRAESPHDDNAARFSRHAIVRPLRFDTEVDWINGEIVRLAAEHGGDAPLNRALIQLIQLIREAEAAGQGSPGLSADVIAKRLACA